jgi:metal-responsive CopG/Arc/MetJ family transcriptional regulator
MNRCNIEHGLQGAPAIGEEKRKYGAVSIPMGILEEIDALISELRYWPSRGAFVREACLEKIRNERERLKELRKT